MLDREARDILVSESNPVFEYERRKIPWVNGISALTQYRQRIWIGSGVAAFVVWMLSPNWEPGGRISANVIITFLFAIYRGQTSLRGLV